MTEEHKAAVAALQSSPAKARHEGAAAFAAGKLHSDNPYFFGARNGWNFDQWNRGFKGESA